MKRPNERDLSPSANHSKIRTVDPLLPTELLLLIAGYLHLSDLLLFVLVHPLLSGLVIPTLRQFGVDIEQHADKISVSLGVSAAYGALAVWRTSPSFRVPHTLHCWIPPDAPFGDVNALSLFFRSLDAYHSIHTIFVDFEGDISLLHSLLSEIPSTGCTNLLLSGSLHKHSLRPHIPLRHSPFEHRVPTSLTAISIATDYVFTRPIVHWTLDVINRAPIERLEISCPTLTRTQWNLLLKRVTVQSLLFLHLQGELPVNGVLRFVNRHPKLLNITIRGLLRPIQRAGRDLSISLPDLMSIDAPISLLVPLIGSIQSTDSLTMVWASLYQGGDHRENGVLTNALLDALRSVRRLYSLRLPIHDDLRFLEAVSSIDEVYNKVLLRRVQYLTLQTGRESVFPEGSTPLIVQWLKCFPALERIQLREDSYRDRRDMMIEIRKAMPKLERIEIRSDDSTVRSDA